MADKTENPPAPPAAAKVSAPEVPDFVIEFGDNLNRSFRFPVGDRSVRGWWKKSNLVKTECDDRFASMPDTPGQRLRVSYRNRAIQLIDPLESVEFKAVFEKAAAVVKSTFGDTTRPIERVEEIDLNDDTLLEYLYWCRRFLDNGQCSVLSGAVPSMDVIRQLPGKLRQSPFDMAIAGKNPRDVPTGYVAPSRFQGNEQ